MKSILTIEAPKTCKQAYKQHLRIGVLLQANNSYRGTAWRSLTAVLKWAMSLSKKPAAATFSGGFIDGK